MKWIVRIGLGLAWFCLAIMITVTVVGLYEEACS